MKFKFDEIQNSHNTLIYEIKKKNNKIEKSTKEINIPKIYNEDLDETKIDKLHQTNILLYNKNPNIYNKNNILLDPYIEIFDVKNQDMTNKIKYIVQKYNDVKYTHASLKHIDKELTLVDDNPNMLYVDYTIDNNNIINSYKQINNYNFTFIYTALITTTSHTFNISSNTQLNTSILQFDSVLSSIFKNIEYTNNIKELNKNDLIFKNLFLRDKNNIIINSDTQYNNILEKNTNFIIQSYNDIALKLKKTYRNLSEIETYYKEYDINLDYILKQAFIDLNSVSKYCNFKNNLKFDKINSNDFIDTYKIVVKKKKNVINNIKYFTTILIKKKENKKSFKQTVEEFKQINFDDKEFENNVYKILYFLDKLDSIIYNLNQCNDLINTYNIPIATIKVNDYKNIIDAISKSKSTKEYVTSIDNICNNINTNADYFLKLIPTSFPTLPKKESSNILNFNDTFSRFETNVNILIGDIIKFYSKKNNILLKIEEFKIYIDKNKITIRPTAITPLNEYMKTFENNINKSENLGELKQYIKSHSKWIETYKMTYGFRQDLIDILNYITQTGGALHFNKYDELYNNIINKTSIKNDKDKHNLNILNNILFKIHNIFTSNIKGKINILTYINYEDVNKYLKSLNNILSKIKTDNSDIFKYLLKYHFFNLKIVKSLMELLLKDWKIYDKSEKITSKIDEIIINIEKPNVEYYFSLFDINYDDSLKRAIMIFCCIKEMLDHLINNLNL